jgi:YjbE family integral membrane protein
MEGISVTGLIQIIISDIVLSGDNAVVIGLAVANLPIAMRRRAILVGTAGAIILRVIFTVIGTVLLTIPLLRFVGGATLLWIGWKLLAQTEESVDEPQELEGGFADAIRTIVIADAVMSLDNALAVAGAADGNIILLVVGLALSIPLLMVGANAVGGLFKRFPWLTLIGAGLIAWVAADLMQEDKLLQQWFPPLETSTALWVLRVICVGGVIALGLRSKRINERRELAEEAARGSG